MKLTIKKEKKELTLADIKVGQFFKISSIRDVIWMKVEEGIGLSALSTPHAYTIVGLNDRFRGRVCGEQSHVKVELLDVTELICESL